MTSETNPRCVLVSCPKCSGYGTLSEPFEQKEDPVCLMCAGAGLIDPEYVCDCSRPAVQELQGKPACLSLDCAKRIEEEAKNPKDSKDSKASKANAISDDEYWQKAWGVF